MAPYSDGVSAPARLIVPDVPPEWFRVRLYQIFVPPHGLAPLIAEACAVDDERTFIARVAETPLEPRHRQLWAVVRQCAAQFADRAGVPAVQWPDDAGRLCFGGQQPYVDYYPAVLAKLDALATCGGASFYGFGDYAALGSDPWMGRTKLPSAAARDGLLRLHFQASVRAHAGRDLRFVPPPGKAAMATVAEKLKATITLAGKHVGCESFSKKQAFGRMRLLLDDYEQARQRARHTGEFNSIWSARVFHRLGFTLPLVSLSELLSRPELLPNIAATLSVFIRHNDLFLESVREACCVDGAEQLHFTRKEAGHVPLALADRDTGFRLPMRCHRTGADHLLCSSNGEVFNVGAADAGALQDLLHRLEGRWSLDVFSPIFLQRLGMMGIVNGRGSIRYSLVLGHVIERLFDMRHVPNLLCSCSPALEGPFVDAVRSARGGLPESLRGCEPTLIMRMLCSPEETIRQEIAVSWRNTP
jgi:hypothetical protein